MLEQMRVGTRLAIAFGVVVALLIGVVVTGVSRMAAVNDLLHSITAENNVESRYAGSIREDVLRVDGLVRDLIITTDDATLASQHQNMQKDTETLSTDVDALDRLFNTLASTTSTESGAALSPASISAPATSTPRVLVVNP